MKSLKTWIISDIMHTAYRHGQAYANGQIYRSTGQWHFKCPEATGLPNWVVQLDIDTHQFLSDVYRHAFRQGLKQGGQNDKNN